ncbi:DPM3 domain containing protein [Asbolus verrucosus]|uniref:Dolichol-phosphate mannosyltransferase subunit 3 n=1 Tax=Asbolus verrucosus TaxID=1661398 RepID=A0A482WC56_ASBVE|nr:DPM3 domain containing protein [Asbolus verrucosus]
MTKLFEWLAVFGVLGAVWLSLVNNKIECALIKQHPTLILFSPVIFLALFGFYAATVVLYRVFTFNNCEKAAAELQEEIQEARTELTKLGFQFKDNHD